MAIDRSVEFVEEEEDTPTQEEIVLKKAATFNAQELEKISKEFDGFI